MKIVVGLGNPGSRYADTRHNVGWMVLDRLADRAGLDGRAKARDGAAVVRGRADGLDVVLVKPTTFMNLSGIAVRKALARERAPLPDLLVVVDDFALPLGRLRLREEGSAGGHNGLRSIIAELETQRFARLRVGIGEPSRDAVDHVLGRFRPDEHDLLEQVLEAATDAVLDWARHGPARAAGRWNPWRPQPSPQAEALHGVPGPEAAHQPSPQAEALHGVPGPEAADRAEVPRPASDPTGEGGIVRTRTGWRRLLPRSRGSGDRGA